MINRLIWKIFAVMIGGSILKYVLVHPLIWVGIDVAVLAVVYLILRREPYINMRRCLPYLLGITAVSALVDLGVVSGLILDLTVLGVVLWFLYRNRRGLRRGGRWY